MPAAPVAAVPPTAIPTATTAAALVPTSLTASGPVASGLRKTVGDAIQRAVAYVVEVLRNRDLNRVGERPLLDLGQPRRIGEIDEKVALLIGWGTVVQVRCRPRQHGRTLSIDLNELELSRHDPACAVVCGCGTLYRVFEVNESARCLARVCVCYQDRPTFE